MSVELNENFAIVPEIPKRVRPVRDPERLALIEWIREYMEVGEVALIGTGMNSTAASNLANSINRQIHSEGYFVRIACRQQDDTGRADLYLTLHEAA